MKKTIAVNVRITKHLDLALKKYAAKNGWISKGAAIRQLIGVALKSVKK